LLKQLKIRVLNQAALDIVFQSLVLNKIIYAAQSYSGYLLEQQIDRLQAMLNSLSLSLHFNGHFPGEPGLAGVYASKG